ncbi:hypothetical protein ACFSM7_12620 [Clavibacter michiganensis subsp. tessellarius]|uniref:hypothetical protein n=1 Tax=Clavibacter tessellarius TaxID=31965 RepID=UPI00362FEAC2
MKGHRVLGGVLVGGVAFIGAAGMPPQVDGPDPNALLDSVEAAAVTPGERREEQEERIRAAHDSSRSDAPALRDDLPHPHDLPVVGTRSLPVASAGEREGRPGGSAEDADPATASAGAPPAPRTRPSGSPAAIVRRPTPAAGRLGRGVGRRDPPGGRGR